MTDDDLQRARELVEQEHGVDWDSLDTGDWIQNARLYKRAAAPLIPKLIVEVERLRREVEHLRKEQRCNIEDIQNMRTTIGEAREALVAGGRGGQETLVEAAGRAVAERDALRSQLASAQQQIAAMQWVVCVALDWLASGERPDLLSRLRDRINDHREYLASQRPPSVASQILGMGVARFEGETREVATVGGEVRCSVYDTECIDPKYCAAAGACCAGDPQCGSEAKP